MATQLVGTAPHASTIRSLLFLALSSACAAETAYTSCDNLPPNLLNKHLKWGHCITTTPRAVLSTTQALTASQKPNTGAIIGGVVGGAAGVATLAAGAGALAVSLQNFLKPPVTHKDTNATGISFEKHGPTTTLKWGTQLPSKGDGSATTISFKRHPELTTTTLGQYVPEVLGMLKANGATSSSPAQKMATVSTTLTENVAAGTDTLRLADVSGLSAGMSLMISGDGHAEKKTIVSVHPDSSRRLSSRRLGVAGGVTLDGPLQYAYTPGALIEATPVLGSVSKLQASPVVKARAAAPEAGSSSESWVIALVSILLCTACLVIGVCAYLMRRRQKKRRKDYEAPDSARMFNKKADAEVQEYEDREVQSAGVYPGMPNILSPFMVTAPTVSQTTLRQPALEQPPSYIPPIAAYSQPTLINPAPVQWIQPTFQAAPQLASPVQFERVQPQWRPQAQLQQRALETFERAVPLVAETGVVQDLQSSFQSSFTYSRTDSATPAGYTSTPQFIGLSPMPQAVTYDVPVVVEPGIDIGFSLNALPAPAESSRPVELVATPYNMPMPNRGGSGRFNATQAGISVAAPPFQANQVMPARLNFG